MSRLVWRGRRTQGTQGGITSTLAYNDADLPLSESHSGGPLNGLTVTVACDSWLRRSRLSLDTQPGLNTVWSYDAAGRLETVSQGGPLALRSARW